MTDETMKDGERAAFEWPPLPIFPKVLWTCGGNALFTEHQMQAYANVYGEAVREKLNRAAAPQATLTDEQRMAINTALGYLPVASDDCMRARITLRALLLQAPTERMSDAETECVHTWIPNSGRGGHPVFRPGRVSYYPIMHITCGKCNARTWVTEPEWKAKIERGEGQS